MTALREAAAKGSTEFVGKLLDSGANVNQQDQYGYTALMQTLSNECIDQLFKVGTDVNIQDKNGKTALHHAANYGFIINIKRLLIHGAKINNFTVNSDDKDDDQLNVLELYLYRAGDHHFEKSHAMKKQAFMLLRAVGETIDETRFDVPDYLKEQNVEPSEMKLSHMCREAIRIYLIELDPH